MAASIDLRVCENMWAYEDVVRRYVQRLFEFDVPEHQLLAKEGALLVLHGVAYDDPKTFEAGRLRLMKLLGLVDLMPPAFGKDGRSFDVITDQPEKGTI